MADIRVFRAAGTTPPVGSGLFPGQLAVTEERLFIGLYNSTDVSSAPKGVAMLDYENVFSQNLKIKRSNTAAFQVIDNFENAHKITYNSFAGKLYIHNIDDNKTTTIDDKGQIYSDGLMAKVGLAATPFLEGHFNKLHLYTAIDGTSNSNQAVNKGYVDALFNANDVMQFKGTIGTGGTPGTLPTTGYSAGWTYRVITAGTYAGKACEVGDVLWCIKDYETAFKNTDWDVQQTNIDGAVVGPASAVDGQLAIYNGTSGKVIKSNANIYIDGTGQLNVATKVIGDLQGNVTGNVTGNLTGTASKATKVGLTAYTASSVRYLALVNSGADSQVEYSTSISYEDGIITANGFIGNLIGTANKALQVRVGPATNGTYYLAGAASTTEGEQDLKVNTSVYMNTATGVINATKFEGLIDCGTWTA